MVAIYTLNLSLDLVLVKYRTIVPVMPHPPFLPGGDDLHIFLDPLIGLLVIHEDLGHISIVVISQGTETYILLFMNHRKGGGFFCPSLDVFPNPQQPVQVPGEGLLVLADGHRPDNVSYLFREL